MIRRDNCDRYASFIGAMRMYRRNGLGPTRSPETWARLWSDIGHAYAKDELSDNEFDDLMNRYAKEMP